MFTSQSRIQHCIERSLEKKEGHFIQQNILQIKMFQYIKHPVLNIFLYIFISCWALCASKVCTEPKCEFHLDVAWSRLMTHRTEDESKVFNVLLEGDKLKIVRNAHRRDDPEIWRYVDPDETLTGDGYPRNIITVNGQFPGPSLEVMEGAEVIIRVTNNLKTQGLSIHWHGVVMKDSSPWMDGVPFMTQCPVQPRQSFTYRFKAYPSGTHWYHGHYLNQRLDGLYGLLVIHSSFPQQPFFPLFVTDWYHVEGNSLAIANPFQSKFPGTGEFEEAAEDDGTQAPSGFSDVPSDDIYVVSALINGRGRYDDRKFPLETYTFTSGITHRFRMVNSGANFPYKLTIDQHKITVVAVDGYETEPIELDGVIIFSGQTIDVEVKAEHTSGEYWLRAQIPDEDPDVDNVKAIISYGNYSSEDPTSEKTVCTKQKPCKILNCPSGSYPSSMYIECISVDTLKSAERSNFKADEEEDIHEIFLNMGYAFGGPSIDGIKHKLPSIPLFQKNAMQKGVTKCSNETCKNGCECTRFVDLPYGRPIQLVMTNYGPDEEYLFFGHHTIHTHGHGFALLKLGYPSFDRETGEVTGPNTDISCDDQDPYKTCKNPKWVNKPATWNLENPPIMDTVIVPSLGYAVLRFKADNPGFWLLHCHINTHSNIGMQLIMREGVEHIPEAPKDYPTCSSFDFSGEENVEEGDTDSSEEETDSSEEDPNDNNTSDADNTMRVSYGLAAGVLIGSVAVGAIIATVPLLLFFLSSKPKTTDM